MRPFVYRRLGDVRALDSAGFEPAAEAPTLAPTQFMAGGTTLLDLMKLDVMQPATVVDINDLEREYGDIIADGQSLRLGALARMSTVCEHPLVQADYPVLAQSLQLAASQQLRNMASLGGTLLQRTRCNYFRDPSYRECNKRDPGSGCAALQGRNRKLAVLGVSDHCIAHYPGDFAQALVALDATAEILNRNGRSRSLPIEELHRLPGDTPHIETVLAPGDLITTLVIPAHPCTRRSLYLKIRDRQSYEFALASAAVALDLRDGQVHEARIALGGVATKPWRARSSEALLKGHPPTEERARFAADEAFRQAVTHGDNDFKPELGRRTLVRALLQCAALDTTT
jgi:xanthine dehydrogenase YagS FAD-binding subunit